MKEKMVKWKRLMGVDSDHFVADNFIPKVIVQKN